MPVVALRIFRSVSQLILVALAAAILLAQAPQQAQAQAPSATARRPIVFIPGLLGSRLCRDNPAKPSEPELVWGSVAGLKQFPTMRLGAGADDLKPCGVVREVMFLGLIVQDVYAPVLTHLETMGYREGKDLFIFDYDWRRSTFENAAKLETFVREKIPDPFQRFDILAHSMGGLIARIYATRHDSGAQLARIFSAGTPFQGSVKVYATVEKGWGALNPVMGGLPAFRRTILSFPSIYELAPRYADCCDAGGRTFALGEGDSWRALKWAGVDPTAMTDLKLAASRAADLRAVIETPLPAGVEDVVLVGTDQRTPLKVAFQPAEGGAIAKVSTNWAGDGTVLRNSAALATATLHPTSFSTHEKILADPQIQQFLEVALTRGVPEAMATVKVRPRGAIRTAVGIVTELVGIVVEPDQPIYRTGELCKVRVHVRLGNTQKLDPKTIRLTRRVPDGSEAVIVLRPDPASSDPNNPFEQSFVGTFNAGVKPGRAMLKADVSLADGKRIVEEPVAVIAR